MTDSQMPKQANADDGSNASEVLATADKTAGDRKATVAELVDALGRRAYGPFVFLIGVLMLTPVGAIPGAPLFSFLFVLLLMTQFLMSKRAPWIPRRLAEIEVDGALLRAGLSRVKPWVRWLDRITGPRLTRLFEPPFAVTWGIACILISLSMVPLGFIPFGVTLPSLSLALIGLGLMNSDGLAALAGLGVAGAAVWLGLTVLEATPT